MTAAVWVALVAVVVAVLSLGLCVVFWQRRHFDAVRFADLRRERDHARGRVEALLIASSGDAAEIVRLRERLAMVEGVMSRSLWWHRRAIVSELPTDADVVALVEMIERQINDPHVELTFDLTTDRALTLLEQLRRECPPPREAA